MSISPLEASFQSIIDRTPEDSSWEVAALGVGGNVLAEARSGPEVVFEALSFTKLIAAHAHELRGDLPLDTPVRLEDTDRKPGGILAYYPAGFELQLGQVASLALTQSDNTALRSWIRMLGGPAEVNNIIEMNSPIRETLQMTRLDPGVPNPDSLDETRRPFYCGITTAREISRLLGTVLKNPEFFVELSHGSSNYALRRFIEPTVSSEEIVELHKNPTILTFLKEAQAAMHQRAMNQRTDTEASNPVLYQKMLRHQYPRTEFPNKIATDGDEGEYHDAAGIGTTRSKAIVTVLSRNYPSQDESSKNPVYYTHGKIGRAVLLSM